MVRDGVKAPASRRDELVELAFRPVDQVPGDIVSVALVAWRIDAKQVGQRGLLWIQVDRQDVATVIGVGRRETRSERRFPTPPASD